MNKIYFAEKFELAPGKFVMKFSCTDLNNVDTELDFNFRSDLANAIIRDVQDRITKVLLARGYAFESMNLRSMSITALKK
jgi:ribosome-associated toxin RatA of RatAB toxin-antitoxin module